MQMTELKKNYGQSWIIISKITVGYLAPLSVLQVAKNLIWIALKTYNFLISPQLRKCYLIT